MPLTDATLNNLGTSLSTLAGFLAIHTADPGTTGTSPAASARVACTWTVDADGDLTLTASAGFTGGAPNGPATWVGLWSASSGGTFRGAFQLTGDQTFNASGAYTVTQITINGTSA